MKKYNERVTELRGRAIQIKELIERAKIEADPANPVFIQTVRGLGYKFEN